MIYCNNLIKSYGQIPVLKGVSLQIPKAKFVSLIGASGAGKSTLLHIIGTLDVPDSGEIEIDSQLVQKLSPKEIHSFRNKKIGFIFQFHHLLPEFTALENAMLPALIAGVNEKEAIEQAGQLLEYLGLANRRNNKPGQLSGGEQQRVALARALINKPKVLLADEPTGNLDQQNAKEVMQLLLKQRNDYNTTTIIVTHDPGIADLTDITFVLKDGLITETIHRN